MNNEGPVHGQKQTPCENNDSFVLFRRVSHKQPIGMRGLEFIGKEILWLEKSSHGF
jgi:hypothetical protein